MQLEDYFDFLAPDDIRLKGHRNGDRTLAEREQNPPSGWRKFLETDVKVLAEARARYETRE